MIHVREILTRPEASQILGAFHYPDTLAASGTTNRLRPIIVNEILGKQARKIGYIDGTDDVSAIVDCATQASSVQKQPLVFRVVFGATEQASVRALSYPLPALQAMQRISEKTGLTSYAQIIFAHHTTSRLNKLTPSKVTEELAHIAAGIRRIVRHMDLAERVGFYDDSPLHFDAVRDAAQVLTRVASDEFLQTLNHKGLHDEPQASRLYAAAHYVWHDSDSPNLRQLSGATIPQGAPIDFGCIQEKYFRNARRLIAQALGATSIAPQIYTRHRIPPYYMARGGDIALANYNAPEHNTLVLAPAVQADIRYLEQSIGEKEFREMVLDV